MEKTKEQQAAKEFIFEAAISKAIQDKRELLKPSIQHFIDGGNVNGEFYIAIVRLLNWVEDKAVQAISEAMGKTKENPLLLGMKIIALGDPISVGIDEIKEVAEKSLDAYEEWVETYATARTEQLQKRVQDMAELLRMADCPESLIESPNSINHQEPSEETREWAKQVIADHKALEDKRTTDEKVRDRVNELELIIQTAMENMILGNGKEAYENLAKVLPFYT